MAKNQLIETLQELTADKSGDSLFDTNVAVDSYKTGIAPLDYYLGYNVNVYGDDDEIVETYPSLGINGGCSVMVIGKSSTAKTSTILFMAGNIVRPFKNGTIIHYDLEQALNMTRAQAMLKFKMSEIRDGKYVLRQSDTSIDDIKESIIKLYLEKKAHPEIYKYKTGKKNEFGEDLEMYEPTVIIIDSNPSLSVKMNENDKKDVKKLEEITSQTDRMRLTGEIGRFYTDILPYLRSVNIILFSVNHIKVNPNMGIVKSPAELLYLKQDEALDKLGAVA